MKDNTTEKLGGRETDRHIYTDTHRDTDRQPASQKYTHKPAMTTTKLPLVG